MSTSCIEKEQQCVLHWFQGWSAMQKSNFLKDMLDKAVPNNVDALFDAMDCMSVRDRPPSIFQCQLKLFTQWFAAWSEAERNQFLIQLQSIDPNFVAQFNFEVQQMNGQRS
ncbi:hypothetical protein LOTGIDRAFT_118580 [Lottia gigantea]|uniref:Uncharacterized protein n=1 Tax=Lottia gigantea TaxID=225164 RepID=V4ABI7_LOTGI|nr:hypothetical protein LOTGIDRAFT_118580 [Lottia gigantea]ESO94182.1 hypothetical protein LOTGIDRAFT_118580 [Lottia gigantea]